MSLRPEDQPTYQVDIKMTKGQVVAYVNRASRLLPNGPDKIQDPFTGAAFRVKVPESQKDTMKSRALRQALRAASPDLPSGR